jgi:hypothetical protein
MKEIINDLKFNDGFELHHVDKLITDRPIAIFNLKNTTKNYPSWQLAQWCSKYNLANGTEKIKQNSTYEIADESKKVTVNVETGQISLELNASNEYTTPRREGENWPHILIEQDFKYKPKIFNCKKIFIELDISLDKVKNCQPETITDIHTAQLSWYFALSDKSETKGKNDFIWFGIPIYDFRYSEIQPYLMQDGGKQENTGKFIYGLGTKNYMDKPFKVNDRIKIKLDVSSYMKEALKIAKQRNYLLNSELKDIVINNTNLGWEITGTFDAELTIYNISVKVDEE